MKAKRIVDGQIVNPEFSRDAKRDAQARGQSYDVREFLTLPKGEIIDDADCWRLCVDQNPQLVPADQECADKVLSVMQAPKRIAFLQRIKRLSIPDVRKQLSKSGQEWLDTMLQFHAEELKDDSPPAAVAKPAAAPAAASK